MLRPLRSILPVAVLAAGWLPAAGCSCPDLECAAAAVAVEMAGEGAGTVEVCINGDCGVAKDAVVFGSGWVELFLDELPNAGVRDDEDFELSITVLDAGGNPLASNVETRKFDVDPCRCLSFPYRWTSSGIDRAD